MYLFPVGSSSHQPGLIQFSRREICSSMNVLYYLENKNPYFFLVSSPTVRMGNSRMSCCRTPGLIIWTLPFSQGCRTIPTKQHVVVVYISFLKSYLSIRLSMLFNELWEFGVGNSKWCSCTTNTIPTHRFKHQYRIR